MEKLSYPLPTNSSRAVVTDNKVIKYQGIEKPVIIEKMIIPILAPNIQNKEP